LALAQTTQGDARTADAANALTDAQRQSIRRIQTEAEKKAAPALLRLAGVMSKVYANMLADKPDAKLRARLSTQMEKATWALFSIKGQSVYEILRVLTPAERQLIRNEMKKPGAPSDLSEVVTHLFKLDDK
jgi:Spy/CpxP family protein refolding chaperone